MGVAAAPRRLDISRLRRLLHRVALDPTDQAVRARAFDFLAEKTSRFGNVLSWKVLHDGFELHGRRVPLIGQQGIFKPAVMPEMPLSIRTAPLEEGRPRPYDDGLDEHGLLVYRYRGTDPTFWQNVGLRKAMHCGVAVCRLRHRELLEAAHILPDKHPQGVPVVPNGLALCKLHHAAFDRHILGIRPDCVIEIRRDILEEIDGPMLRHGLQEMAGWKIGVPRQSSQHPRTEFLEERYELFRKAG